MRHHPYFVSTWQVVPVLVGSVLAAGLIGAGGCSSSGSASSATLSQNVGGAAGSNTGNSNTATRIAVTVTPLVSDRKGAANLDPDLVNPWGLAINPNAEGGPLFWTADNGSGLATVYDASGAPQSLVVTIPPARGETGPSAPTGQVWNAISSSFLGDTFIFASEDGVLSGWQSSAGTDAVVRADRSKSKALYKGLAIVRSTSPDVLVAANFRAGTVDVFDGNYRPVSTLGAFVDPTLPTGFAPFNVASLGSKVYVSYAKQDADQKDDVAGEGNGRIDVFNPDGTFVKTLVDGGALNSPWGMATLSSSALGSVLLVGNFGDGKIHAYDLKTGRQLAEMLDQKGKPLVIDGLWALAFVPPKGVAGVVPGGGSPGTGGAGATGGTGGTTGGTGGTTMDGGEVGPIATGGTGGTPTEGDGGPITNGGSAGVDGGPSGTGATSGEPDANVGSSSARVVTSPPLYFTAGPNKEEHGVFGRIDLAL